MFNPHGFIMKKKKSYLLSLSLGDGEPALSSNPNQIGFKIVTSERGKPILLRADSTLNVKQLQFRTLADSLNGKHLRIGTVNSIPFSGTEPGPNGTLVGKGVAFILIAILQKKFNFTYDLVVPENNAEFGGKKPEDSLVNMLINKQIDMAACFLPKLIRYYQSFQYSVDLDEGIWMMMLKRPKASAAGSGLMAPFNALVWYLTLISVLCYGPCISLLTRLRAKLIHDKEKSLNVSPSFWFVYSAFVKQGTELAPEANTTRVLFATWWLFIILLSAFYTANLTAFLTLSKFTLDIETPEDLNKKNYRWLGTEGGAVQYAVKSTQEGLDYLNKMVENHRAEFKNFPNLKDYLSYVNEGVVLVKESVSIDHIMYSDYLAKARDGVQESDRCTYVVAPKPFMKKLRAFGYPIDSPLKVLFDSVLMYIVQGGIIKFQALRNLPSTKICPLDLQSKDRQLRNSDLIMTYLLMGGGLAAAAAVFIGEILIKRYFAKPTVTGEGKLVRTKKKSKKRQRDNSRPPPYESIFGKTHHNINVDSQRKIINGREYYVFNTNGETRLVPVRAPSAFLYR